MLCRLMGNRSACFTSKYVLHYQKTFQTSISWMRSLAELWMRSSRVGIERLTANAEVELSTVIKVWLVTSRLETGKPLTIFYSVLGSIPASSDTV